MNLAAKLNQECVVGVYASLLEGEAAMNLLREEHYPADQVAVVSTPAAETPELIEDFRMAGDDSVQDAAIGAGLGGVLGVLAGVTAMTVSGLGLVFLAGPLGGGLFGALVGGLIGGIAGWGVHDRQVEHYRRCLREGKPLMIVHGTPLEIERADSILKNSDALEVHLHARTSSESPEIMDD